jgi:phosphoglycolate phosphatase
MGYRAICFDFDYTLGDATYSILAGARHALEGLGWPAPGEEEVRRTVGYTLEDSYTLLTGDCDPERQREYRRLFMEKAHPIQTTTTRLFPGAEELLRALKGRGIGTGVVSTKRAQTLEGILSHCGVRPLLDLVLGGDSVERPKPDPQGLLLALEQLGVAPEEALFCGDTVIDAETAQRAGSDFCAVLNGTTPAEAFASYPCAHVATDLVEMISWLQRQDTL